MSVSKYNASTGELTTIASGQRTQVGTKAAYDQAKIAGTLPNNALIAITDDEKDHNHYSIDEIATGEYWIDGKPIYRKVMTGTFNDGTSIDIGVTNIETFVKIDSYTIFSNGYSSPLPYCTTSGNIATLRITPLPNPSLLFTLASEQSNNTYHVILEYTKTTD